MLLKAFYDMCITSMQASMLPYGSNFKASDDESLANAASQLLCILLDFNPTVFLDGGQPSPTDGGGGQGETRTTGVSQTGGSEGDGRGEG